MIRVITVISILSVYFPLVLQSEDLKNAPVVTTDTTEDYEDVTDSGIEFRVKNGRPVRVGEIPYQVSFKKPAGRGAYTNFCGGSVIGKAKVLTAGHCLEASGTSCDKICKKVKTKNLMKYYAVAGNIHYKSQYKRDNESTEQWRQIESAAIHRRFWFPQHDIAVVYLKTPFVYNKFVYPIALAKRFRDYGSRDCIASGLGLTDRHRQASPILLKANIRLLPAWECSKIHQKNMHDFICSSTARTDVQPGDSGGPLVCDGVQVGVVCGARFIDKPKPKPIPPKKPPPKRTPKKPPPKRTTKKPPPKRTPKKPWQGVRQGAGKKPKHTPALTPGKGPGAWNTYFTRVSSYVVFIANRATVSLATLYVIWLPIINLA